jgi:subtilase family serine protease
MEKAMRMDRIPGRRPYPWLAAASLAAVLAAAGASAALGSTHATPPAQLNCGMGLGGPVPCYSPQEYQVAYGVTPLLRRGIDGRGETIVVGPEPAAAPPSGTDIRQDLAYFDQKFRLPRARLHIVNTTAKSAAPYLSGPEEVTDTELAHAFAPGASLDVILTAPDTAARPATFAAAITTTIQQGTARHAAVISISASVGERYLTHAEVARMHAALERARGQHVTVVTSSGDSGAIASFYGPPVQVSMPTSDPLVLGAGGTILDATPAGRYLGEMAWNDNTEASGGGYSTLFPRPAYQNGLAQARTTRGVPDVSANADGSTAMALALVAHSHRELRASGGTSSAAPLWAGVIALADQQAGRHLGLVNPALYAIARGPAYHQGFHDVVTGDNSILWPTGVFTGYNAGPGWDPVTGLGSPDAQYLVPLLARTGRPGA